MDQRDGTTLSLDIRLDPDDELDVEQLVAEVAATPVLRRRSEQNITGELATVIGISLSVGNLIRVIDLIWRRHQRDVIVDLREMAVRVQTVPSQGGRLVLVRPDGTTSVHDQPNDGVLEAALTDIGSRRGK